MSSEAPTRGRLVRMSSSTGRGRCHRSQPQHRHLVVVPVTDPASVQESHRPAVTRQAGDYAPGSTLFSPSLSPFPECRAARAVRGLRLPYSANWNKFGMCKCTGEEGGGAGHERGGRAAQPDPEPVVHGPGRRAGPPGRAGAEKRRLEASII